MWTPRITHHQGHTSTYYDTVALQPSHIRSVGGHRAGPISTDRAIVRRAPDDQWHAPHITARATRRRYQQPPGWPPHVPYNAHNSRATLASPTPHAHHHAHRRRASRRARRRERQALQPIAGLDVGQLSCHATCPPEYTCGEAGNAKASAWDDHSMVDARERCGFKHAPRDRDAGSGGRVARDSYQSSQRET